MRTHIKAGMAISPVPGVFTACGRTLRNGKAIEPDAIAQVSRGIGYEQLRAAARHCGVDCAQCLHSSFTLNGGMF